MATPAVDPSAPPPYVNVPDTETPVIIDIEPETQGNANGGIHYDCLAPGKSAVPVEATRDCECGCVGPEKAVDVAVEVRGVSDD